MTKQFMFVGLLLLGGCLWVHAQTDSPGSINQSVPMTVGQLFEKVEDNSKSLRAQKTGVAAAGLGVEAARSKRLPDIDASLSFSYLVTY